MSGIDTQTVESAITTDWTKANLQKLLAAMKTCIPEEERMSAYTKGLKAVDWEKVAFSPFSPEACQEKWKEILQTMRKTRTLTELINEAEDVFSSPVKRKRAQYVEKQQLKSEEHNRGMLELGKQSHRSPKHKCRTDRKRKGISTDGEQCIEGADGLPPKPPVNGYNLFCKEQLMSMAGVSKRAYVSVWAQRWRDLTERQRYKYSIRCRELQSQYTIKLNEYLQTLGKEEQQRILSKHGIKRRKANKKEVKFPGEPKMPSRSGNVIFCKDQMELLREKFPNSRERFIKVSQMWKDLSEKEKERYKEKVNQNFEKYSMELQKWFKALKPEEQNNYQKYNLNKCKYFDEEDMNVYGRERNLRRPSDSEDEDIDDSSSDEEEHNRDCEEDEEEEEEEEEEGDDNMFEMY